MDQQLLERARHALGARTEAEALLAARCACLGLTVLTRNEADFQRVGRYLAVRTVAPIPR